jgi:hypothetical protein
MKRRKRKKINGITLQNMMIMSGWVKVNPTMVILFPTRHLMRNEDEKKLQREEESKECEDFISERKKEFKRKKEAEANRERRSNGNGS